MFLFAVALAANAAAAPPTRVEDDPVVCKTQPRTNSRMGKRLCLRKSEMEARAVRHQRQADETINRPAINRGDNG